MMNKLHEDKLSPIIINLSENRLDESGLRALGKKIELLLKRMFGMNEFDFRVRGPKLNVDKFLDALRGEREYNALFRQYGLDNPRTWESKYKLDSAIRNFERSTGIKWPIK